MTNKLEQRDKLFNQIWFRFNSNVGSLLMFSREITTIADRLDQEKIHEVAADLAHVFGDEPADVEKELLEFFPSLDHLEIYPDFRQNPDVKEIFAFFQTGEFKKRTLDWVFEHPAKANKLANVINTEFNEPPNNGIILRRSALIQLTGFLELLLQDLFFAYLYLHPDNKLAQQDNAMLKIWAQDQAEIKMKGGWRKRIENISALEADLGSTEQYLDDLIEITQRRNLMVHNDGVIDDDFLERIPDRYKNEKEWKPGQTLVVSTEYLQRAFDVTHLIGCILNQAIWRKWAGTSPKKASETFSNFIFTVLKQERYQLVSDLADFSVSLSLPKKISQIVKVNQAIAFRETKQHNKLQRSISELSRSNPSLPIQIALSVLRMDYKNTQILLVHAANKNLLKNISKDWPLFYPIKNEPWFITLFNRVDRGDLPKLK